MEGKRVSASTTNNVSAILLCLTSLIIIAAQVDSFFYHPHHPSSDSNRQWPAAPFPRHHNRHRRPHGNNGRWPTTTPRLPSFTLSMEASNDMYWQLVREAHTWQTQNPTACGADTQNCSLQQLLNGFNTCTQSRIVNGCQLFTTNVVGWQVAITLGSGLCSGTIVSPTIILTAAHCLQSITAASQITVYIGVTDINRATQAQTYTVQNFAQNPMFDYTAIVHDSAVLRLAREIVWQNGVRPACLPTSLTPRTLTNCLVSGYGINTTTSNPSSAGGGGAGILRYAVLSMSSDRKCDQTYGQQFDPTVSFCALGSRQSRGSDTCGGDSGSGLMCRDTVTDRWVVRGIVSYGVPTCGSQPGVYADPFALGLRGATFNRLQTGTSRC